MKKRMLILPFALIASFAVGCGHNPGTSDGPSSHLPGSSDTGLGSSNGDLLGSSNIGPGSSDQGITMEDVEEKLGDIAKLQTNLQALPTKDVQEISVTKERTFNSNVTTTTETTQFKTQEVLTSSGKEMQYKGYVDPVYYDITKNKYSTFGSRQKVGEADSALTETAVLENLNDLYTSKLDLTASLWKDFFSGESSYYNLYLPDAKDYIRVRASTFSEQKGYNDQLLYGYVYNFVALFSPDFQLTEGTLNISKYQADNWNVENQSPIDSENIYQKDVIALSSITYGEKVATTTPMIDMSTYWTTSVSNIYCTTQYLNETTWMYVTPDNPNDLFAGSEVILNEDFLCAPETAIDRDTIRILSSSNENAVRFDADMGYWAAQTVGETATLTIGNDFNPNLAQVEVTVIDMPVSQNTPMISPSNEWDLAMSMDGSTEATFTAYDETLETATLKLTQPGNANYLIATQNAGPFDGLEEITFQCLDGNEAVATLSVDTEMNASMSNLPEDYWYYAFISVTAHSAGTTKYAILYQGEPIRELTIIVG